MASPWTDDRPITRFFQNLGRDFSKVPDYGWKVGTVAYALAGFVGWSRVRDGRHWPSDVAMGSAIGIVSARAVTGKHTGRWLITPVKTTGGVAVYVTRRPAATVR